MNNIFFIAYFLISTSLKSLNISSESKFTYFYILDVIFLFSYLFEYKIFKKYHDRSIFVLLFLQGNVLLYNKNNGKYNKVFEKN